MVFRILAKFLYEYTLKYAKSVSPGIGQETSGIRMYLPTSYVVIMLRSVWDENGGSNSRRVSVGATTQSAKNPPRVLASFAFKLQHSGYFPLADKRGTESGIPGIRIYLIHILLFLIVDTRSYPL